MSTLRGGGIFGLSKLKRARFWPNFNVGGRGEIFLGSKKCQVLAKFQWGRGGYSWIVKTQCAKSWPNLNFRGGVYSWVVKNSVFLGKCSKNSGSLACSCIADSLRVETNEHEEYAVENIFKKKKKFAELFNPAFSMFNIIAYTIVNFLSHAPDQS